MVLAISLVTTSTLSGKPGNWVAVSATSLMPKLPANAFKVAGLIPTPAASTSPRVIAGMTSEADGNWM
jgi:hypothetical protein